MSGAVSSRKPRAGLTRPATTPVVATTTTSIIIVSYNTRALTLDCIASVYRETTPGSFELLIVDNNSSDGSAEAIRAAYPEDRYPELTLFALKENLGFARANNMAAEHAVGKYVLLLNPDTVVLDRALDTLVAFADAHPEYGIYGGSTVFADGSPNPTAGWMKPTAWSLFCVATGLSKLFPRSRVFNPESLAGRDWTAPIHTDIVTGCLFLMRRPDWNELGGFDPRYFMYGEDADICLRAARTGLTAVLAPDAQIVHYGGASEPKRADKMVRLFTAKVQLCRAHYAPLRAELCVWMLGFWCLTRIVMFAAVAPFKRNAGERKAQWIEIWRKRDAWATRKVA